MHAEAIWACPMLCSVGNYNNLIYYPAIQGSCDVKHRSRKLKSSLNICLCLKTAASSSTKVKSVDKDGEVVLAHCEKHSKDSVGLASLCKL